MARLGSFATALVVRCLYCRKTGAYRVARLLDRFGPDIRLDALHDALTRSCPYRTEAFEVELGRAFRCLADLSEYPSGTRLSIDRQAPGPWQGAVFRVDTWTERGEFEQEIALIHDFDVARRTYAGAVRRWPDLRVTLRQGAWVMAEHEPHSYLAGVCNLYSMVSNREAIRRLFRVTRDDGGNLPSLPGIFPDQLAPVVRNADGERELLMMRWGIAGPKQFGEKPVTNVRNVQSRHWSPWLSPAHRCLVPVTSFSEYADTKPKKTPVWFALDDDRPLFAFAGIWRPWTGVRGTKAENPDRLPQEHLLFSFLTTEPNGIVGPVHPKAMPVMLTTEDEWSAWLEAPMKDALALQRPLLDAMMKEVARGERRDDFLN